jgi:hypothetical protein
VKGYGLVFVSFYICVYARACVRVCVCVFGYVCVHTFIEVQSHHARPWVRSANVCALNRLADGFFEGAACLGFDGVVVLVVGEEGVLVPVGFLLCVCVWVGV